MKKSIVIITAHPDKDSLCHANADALEVAAKKQGLVIHRFDAFDFSLLKHNPVRYGFPKEFNVPRDAVCEAQYLAVCVPMWNFCTPGALKNFFDGMCQAKYFFQLSAIGYPVGLLRAKKLLVVVTTDGPAWYYKIFSWKNLVFHQIKAIFGFCGVHHFEQLILGNTSKTSDQERKRWIEKLQNYKF